MMLRRGAAALLRHPAPQPAQHQQIEEKDVVSVSVGEDEVHPVNPRQANSSSGEEASPQLPLRGHPSSLVRPSFSFLPSSTQMCCACADRGGVSLVLPLLTMPSFLYAGLVCVWVCVSPSSSSASPLHQPFLFRLPPHSHPTQEHEHPTGSKAPTSSPASGSHHGTYA